jgi:hypothetical protein
MGVDCLIRLNSRCRLRDVADVIGILSGLKPERRHFASGTGWGVEVKGVSVKSTCVPEMAEIRIVAGGEDALVDGELAHFVMFHWEGDNGGRVLSQPSTPFWCALAKRLVDVFGGSVDFNDCDGSEEDYRADPPTEYDPLASDDTPWYVWQERQMGLKPLTKKKLKAGRRVAAYT